MFCIFLLSGFEMTWGGTALLVLLISANVLVHAQEEDWAHAAWLDEKFLLRWTPGPEDVTFEVTAQTLGYVGFGISHDGRMQGSDLVIGWLQHGRVHFQVCLIFILYSNYVYNYTQISCCIIPEPRVNISIS
jgi:hypothetical protein